MIVCYLDGNNKIWQQQMSLHVLFNSIEIHRKYCYHHPTLSLSLSLKSRISTKILSRYFFEKLCLFHFLRVQHLHLLCLLNCSIMHQCEINLLFADFRLTNFFFFWFFVLINIVFKILVMFEGNFNIFKNFHAFLMIKVFACRIHHNWAIPCFN